MPWFPDFASAVELARRQTQEAGRADPVAEYFAALNQGDTHVLETVWPGEVVIFDPRAGEVRGHKQLRRFVSRNKAFLAERHADTQKVAATCGPERAVVELLADLTYDGRAVRWPLAVVAESPDDRSVVFRTYCTQWPVDGQRHVRPPMLEPDDVQLDEVVSRYQEALNAGDVDAIVQTFAPDGYLREPLGPEFQHRGHEQLHTYFSQCFSAGGGIDLQPCSVTDDGVRCALEYNCVRWGGYELPPQAGIAIFERGPAGLLAAVRVYDDVKSPLDRS
jgi:ketosteroid isomerase-like protein